MNLPVDPRRQAHRLGGLACGCERPCLFEIAPSLH